MTADLRLDTSVTPVAGFSHRYQTDLPDRWNWRFPSGGVLMTLGLRAIRATIPDPAFVIVSATTTFCQPVPAGRIEIDVFILRQGNAASQVRACLRAAGVEGVCLEVTATLAIERNSPAIDFLDAVFPDVPLPKDAQAFDETQRIGLQLKRYPILDNIDVRLALGQVWWKPDFSAGPARFARWIRYKTPQKDASGRWDPLALPPIIDMMPTAVRQKMGPNGPPYYAPSLDLTIHFLDPTDSEWLLISTFVRRARAGYATAEAEVWSEDGKLVAYATQTMFLRAPRA